MVPTTRRAFLTDVSRGMLVAGLGATLARDMGFRTVFAGEGPGAIELGEYKPLVELMQATPPDKLQPILVDKLRRGETDLKTLISAAALANAETFGGQDYIGFHTAMAMLPALEMSKLLPSERQPLPVLKVLYRNSNQIQQLGGASKKTLLALHAADHAGEGDIGLRIRDACRQANMDGAENIFATLAASPPVLAFNALQPAVQDDINVHRYVLAHRAYGLVGLLGADFAHTLLRQCVRYCVNDEMSRLQHHNAESPIRVVLPKLLDQYHLVGQPLGKRDPGDAEVDALSLAIYMGPPAKSAEAVAGALADGVDPEVVGEAISLASNLLVLRQGAEPWRTHGASAGVHSSDATNAWRNMARVIEPSHAIAGLIVAAYHSASHSPFQTGPYPTAEHRAAIKAQDAKGLLAEAEDAVRHNDQGRAAAAVEIYGEHGFAVEPVFNMLLKYAVSEDGRLHGEKYYQTVCEEFRTIRPAFRWREMVGLARVNASAFGYNGEDKPGYRAPGYEDACRLLGVEV